MHKKTNLEICGIIDDVWINKQEELIIVDYKSTSTSAEIGPNLTPEKNDKYT